MTNLIFLIIGTVFGFSFGWLMAARQYRLLAKRVSKEEEVPSNLAEINEKKQLGVAANHRRILALLKKRGSVKNDDLENLLGVSDATVTRYMDQLEKEGKVAQRSATGRGVSYMLK